jgi:hypothetical protein
MATTAFRHHPAECTQTRTKLKPLHPLQHHRQLLPTEFISFSLTDCHSNKQTNLQHFRRNSHDAPSEFLIQSAVFGIVGGIIESLATKLVFEFVEDCVLISFLMVWRW